MIRVFIPTIALFLLVFSVSGQTEVGSLKGQVKDEVSTVSLAGFITLVDKNSVEKASQTNESGAFSFGNLPVGK